jgi:hypothetical protein
MAVLFRGLGDLRTVKPTVRELEETATRLAASDRHAALSRGNGSAATRWPLSVDATSGCPRLVGGQRLVA